MNGSPDRPAILMMLYIKTWPSRFGFYPLSSVERSAKLTYNAPYPAGLRPRT